MEVAPVIVIIRHHTGGRRKTRPWNIIEYPNTSTWTNLELKMPFLKSELNGLLGGRTGFGEGSGGVEPGSF